jgi:hypothetical protein
LIVERYIQPRLNILDIQDQIDGFLLMRSSERNHDRGVRMTGGHDEYLGLG